MYSFLLTLLGKANVTVVCQPIKCVSSCAFWNLELKHKMQFWHRIPSTSAKKKITLHIFSLSLFKNLGKSVLSSVQKGVLLEEFFGFTVAEQCQSI